MSDDTVTAPAEAGEMNEADAQKAFDALVAVKDAAASPEVVEDDTTIPPAEVTPAAPAAAVIPAAPAPAAAASDIWATATPEIRAAHEAAVEAERQKYRSDIGRQAAHQREIANLREQLAARTATPAAAPASPAPAPLSLRETPGIKKALEEYPEVAAPFVDALEPLVAENARLSRDLSTLNDDRRANVNKQQEQALDAAHPDWRAACGTKDFADWLNAQPNAIKEIVKRNGDQVVDAQEAIAMVGNFKAYVALTKPAPQPVVAPTPHAVIPTPLAQRRDAQLHAVTADPKGGPTAIPDGAPGGSEKALFDHFVAKKAKKG